jgi:hypothetical protein
MKIEAGIQSLAGMCKTRLDTKIHPRPRRGCKVRLKSGSHHRPAVDAGFGATRRRKYGNAERREIRGNLEIPQGSVAKGAKTRGDLRIHPRQPEDAASGATRVLIVGAAETENPRGNLRPLSSVTSRDANREATRGSIAGKAGRLGVRGYLDARRRRCSRTEARGNPKLRRRHR